MNSFWTWLAMGGYSAYVWSAYGLVGGVLLIKALSVRWQTKQTHQKLQQWFKSLSP